jgi:hypothetical protein
MVDRLAELLLGREVRIMIDARDERRHALLGESLG